MYAATRRLRRLIMTFVVTAFASGTGLLAHAHVQRVRAPSSDTTSDIDEHDVTEAWLRERQSGYVGFAYAR